MRIALFYPKNIYASWYTLGGYRETLRRMGHEVMDVPFPGNQVLAGIPVPSIEQLEMCDCILSMFHEYTQPWLSASYKIEDWKKLRAVKIARFDESFDRDDLAMRARWKDFQPWADHFSFPAHQDAAKYGGEFLPFSADTTLFKPDDTTKKFPLGFVGSLYPLRMNYLQQLAEHIPNTVTFNCGPVVVQDLRGHCERESTDLLIQNYRQIKVFFCLPPMSRLLVCKVWEVMACGTFVMYPKLPGDARRNNEVFKDGEHLVYYDPGRFPDNGRQIMKWLENEDEREKIARAGCEFVHKNFTLEGMLQKIMAPALKPALVEA